MYYISIIIIIRERAFKMFTLPSDMQKLTCDFLGLREINVLYCVSKGSKEMFEVLTEHTNFTINAKVILTDERIEWFESRNIKVNLLKEVIINTWGTYWYTNGELNGPDDDSPAVEYVNGTKEYYKKGIRHRLNGPAIIFYKGTKEWWENGLRHRLNGPAIKCANGSKEYYKKGRRHRINGPALIHVSGTEEWWKNGLRHRLKGPAIKCANGDEEWWENGSRHRLDGPAATYIGFVQHWYKNGELHRLDGPATVFDTGGEEWFEDGLCHRLNGPAIIKSNGDVEFWEYGVQIV